MYPGGDFDSRSAFAGAVSAIGRAIFEVVFGSATLRIHPGLKQCAFGVHLAGRLGADHRWCRWRSELFFVGRSGRPDAIAGDDTVVIGRAGAEFGESDCQREGFGPEGEPASAGGNGELWVKFSGCVPHSK